MPYGQQVYILVALHLKRNARRTTLEEILVHAISEPNRARMNALKRILHFQVLRRSERQDASGVYTSLRWTKRLDDLLDDVLHNNHVICIGFVVDPPLCTNRYSSCYLCITHRALCNVDYLLPQTGCYLNLNTIYCNLCPPLAIIH